MNRLRRALPWLALPLAYLALPLLLFWPVLGGQATMVPFDNLYQGLPWSAQAAEVGVGAPHNELVSDLVLQNLQWKAFAVERFRAGELPLWQNRQFAGTPFLAAGQHSMLYPLSALFIVLPAPMAFGWFTVLSLMVAGLTMHALARALGLRRSAALIAGLAYQGSAFLTISVLFPMIVAGAAWLPLLLAALHRLSDGERRDAGLPWLGIGALAVGVAALAGHVEIFYYTLLVGAFYALWRLVALFVQRRPRAAARFVATGATTVIVGVLLGAAQLLPLYELVTQNFREGSADLASVRGYAWPPRQAASFLVPDLLGDPSRHTFYNLETRRWEPIVTQQPINDQGDTAPLDHIAWFKGAPRWKNYVEGAGYLGVLPLLLALIAITKRQTAKGKRQKAETERQKAKVERQKAKITTSGEDVHETRNTQQAVQSEIENPKSEIASPAPFATLSILSLLFIFGTPLYALLFYGLPGWSQLHTPFRWLFPLSLCVSVLAGMGWERLRAGEAPRIGRALGGAALAAGGVGLALLLLMAVAPGPWIAQAAKLLDRSQLTQWAFGGSAALFVSYQWQNFLHLALALLGSGLVIWLAAREPFKSKIAPPARKRNRKSKITALAALVLLLDLAAAAHGFMPRVAARVAEHVPPALAWLDERHEAGAWRYTALEFGHKVFNANATMRFGLEDIRGYDSIIPRHTVQFMEAVAPQDQLDFNRIAPLRPEPEKAPDQALLDLLNVRYLATDQALDWPGWALAYEGELRIYENQDVMARAFLLGAAEALAGPPTTEQLRALDPRATVLIEGDEVPSGAQPYAPATITRYTPDEIFIEAAPGAGTWLVLSEVDFPGWRAFTRAAGEEVETELAVRRANGAFRAVWIEAGAQTVRFKYSPDSVKIGLFASFLGVAALLFAGVTWAWGRLYVPDEREGNARRVARNAGAPMALQLFNKGIDTVFAAFMARFLGPEALGQYAFAVAFIWYFIIFSNFGLGTLLTRDAARDRDAAGRLLNTTIALRAALYAVAFPLLLALLALWGMVGTLEREAYWAILLLALGLIPSNLADALTAIFRAHERFEIPALVATIATFVKVVLGAAVLLIGWGIVGLAATSIVTNGVTLAVLAWLLARTVLRPTWGFSLAGGRGLLRDAFPLMINEFLATAFFRIDQVMLKPMRGNAEAGFYNVAYKFIDGLLILPSSLTLALFPLMSRHAQGAPDALLRTTRFALRWLLLVALPIALLTTRYAEGIVLAFGGPEFLPRSATGLQILIWFLPFSFANSLVQYVLIAAGQQARLTRAYLWGLGFNLVANVLAIRAFGLYGAAAVTALSEIALLVPFDRLIRRHVGALPWGTLLGKPTLAAAAAALPLWLGGLPFWLAIPASLLAYAAVLALLRAFEADDRVLVARLVRKG